MANDSRVSCFPYGPLYAIPATLTVLGLIFYHVAAFGCTTFKVTSVTGYYYYYSYDQKYGYWGVDTGSGCVSLGDVSGNGVWMFGRAIAIIGALLIWGIFGVVVTASFVKFPKIVLKIFGGLMGVVSICSFLLLTGLADSPETKLSTGGYMTIISGLFWAGGAASMFICMKERSQVSTSSSTTNAKPSPPGTAATNEAPTNTPKYDPEIAVTESADDAAQ